MTEPVKVLFVCTANICRSAYAHARALTLIGDKTDVVVASAGTWGFDASPMDPPMAALATSRGSDPSAFRSQRLNAQLVRDADVILAATTEHRAFILEDWPTAFKKTFTLGQFAEAVADADPSVRGRELIAHAQRRRTAARAASDIKDPYNRGEAAAKAAADQIDSLLDAVIPRLSA